MSKSIVFVMGPTCSGKSTFLSFAKEKYGAQTIQIGQELRAKYGEAFFNGQGAVPSLHSEVLSTLKQRISECNGTDIILVDGMPRSVSQAEQLMADYPTAQYLMINCPTEERIKRAFARDKGEALELTRVRAESDIQDNYEVLIKLLAYGMPVNIHESGIDNMYLTFEMLVEEV